MVNLDSDVARQHPEWVMATGGRLPLPARHQQVLNLGIEECYAYIRDAIFAMLTEYDISYIKWDHNRDLLDAGTQPGGGPGVHEQTLAVYRLMDEIKATHPGLEIESCASGGARVDLGILERTHRVWTSDCNDAVERTDIQLWTTLLLPPELVGAHVGPPVAHTTHRHVDLGMRCATALFGHAGLEWDITTCPPVELDQLRDWISLYKELRPVLHSGDAVSYTHLRAHETRHDLVCRLLLE